MILSNLFDTVGYSTQTSCLLQILLKPLRLENPENCSIVKANSAVHQLISCCVACRRNKDTPEDHEMADLPENRVTLALPFTYMYITMDYFGPYFRKEGHDEHKRYGALFTCLVSRAVHI